MKPTSLILPLCILLAILLALLIIWALLSRAKARQRQRQQRVRRAPQPSSMEAGQRNDKGSGVERELGGGTGGGVDQAEAGAERGFGVELERVWARGDGRVSVDGEEGRGRCRAWMGGG